MEQALSRQAASEAVGEQGWRFLLGTLRTAVPVGSLTEGASVVAAAVAACGDHADGHLRADLRPDRVVLELQSRATAWVTEVDTDLAHRITAAVRELGLRGTPEIGTTAPRSLQIVEIGIDALDIPRVRPFWAAVLGYVDDDGALSDPVGQGPAVWFQQMDEPRPERNRVHFDVCVPHDEAERRLKAALSAGGRLLSDLRAPSFWVLADPEGNEACITTWQGRD
ncbi:VOC family protein [Actinoplanes sp. NPDC049265]|uniref:VOC family protein n=1 Tax=Actinoplanes sp. NPDC049265 TaxID=3363902 RepID=UPI00371AE815